jgi:U3 small nucleolar RNA-associated protein 10
LELFQSLFARLRLLSQQLHGAHVSSNSVLVGELQPLIARSRTALDNLTGLLSPKAFVAVTRSLLSSDDAPIRQAALTLLSDKVGQQPEDLTDEDTKLYLQLLPSLERLLIEDKVSSSTSSDDSLTSKQATLLAVDALVRALGHRDDSRDAVLAILPSVRTCAEHAHSAIATSSLIALESMVTALGLHVLAHLPKLFPLAMDVLDRTLSSDAVTIAHTAALVTKGKRKANEEPSTSASSVSAPATRAGIEQLQVSALAALSSMVEQLPQYLSPYLGRLLELLLHPAFAPLVASPLSSISEAAEEVKKGEHTDATLATISRTLATLGQRVEARVLVPQLLAVFPKALSYGSSSLVRLFAQLSSLCTALPTVTITEQYTNIVRLLLLGLDVRRLHGAHSTANNSDARLATSIDSIEDSVIDAFMALALKTDEKQFKGMFMKTLQWLQSTSALANALEGKDEARPVEKLGQSSEDLARALTFFRLVDRLITRLKGLFVRYFGYLLEHCVTLLRQEEEKPLAAIGDDEGTSTSGGKRRRKDKSGARATTSDGDSIASQRMAWRNQLTTTIVGKSIIYHYGKR